MDTLPALTDIATGLLVAAVLLVRYGAVFPGSRLHHLIGWRGCPLGWTPDPCRGDDDVGAGPRASWEVRRPTESPTPLPAGYTVYRTGGMAALCHDGRLVAAFGTGTPEDKIVEVALRHAALACAVSDRELHILLHFLHTGASPAEIARAWGTAPREVRRAITAALQKMGIPKRARRAHAGKREGR